MWSSIYIKRQEKTFQQLSRVSFQFITENFQFQFQRCGEDIPPCRRCDDFCSIKDGKSDKTEYREERDQPKDDHSSEDIDNDSNSDNEEDKKSAGESEETSEIEIDDSSSNQIDETNEEGSKEKEDFAGESAENRWRRIRF